MFDALFFVGHLYQPVRTISELQAVDCKLLLSSVPQISVEDMGGDETVQKNYASYRNTVQLALRLTPNFGQV